MRRSSTDVQRQDVHEGSAETRGVAAVIGAVWPVSSRRMSARVAGRCLGAACLATAWGALFFAAWNFVQDDELAPLPVAAWREVIWTAVLPLLVLAGAAAGRRRWLLVPMPPLVVFTALVALDRGPTPRWHLGGTTTTGWILLAILIWSAPGLGSLLARLLRRAHHRSCEPTPRRARSSDSGSRGVGERSAFSGRASCGECHRQRRREVRATDREAGHE